MKILKSGNVKRHITFLTIAVTMSLMTLSAQAVAFPIALFDYACNVDGSNPIANPVPAGVDISGFDVVTGLGEVVVTVNGAGLHYVACFFDHDIDESINGFFNEHAVGFNAPAPGQLVEADEPGFVFGDIFANLVSGTLDNTNAVAPGSEEDVSMAISWDFVLAAGETGIVRFFLSQVNGAGGAFYLEHRDPDSGPSIFFWSSVEITGSDTDGDSIPDADDLCPGTAAGAQVDADGCSDDQLDLDNDGVLGAVDVCPNTVITESVPTRSLGVNRFALVDGDDVFDTKSPRGKGPRRSYTTADTAGCSCTQIIDALGLGRGHTKFGCSISAMDDWVELVNP